MSNKSLPLGARLDSLSVNAWEWLEATCEKFADGECYIENLAAINECLAVNLISKSGRYIRVSGDVMNAVYSREHIRNSTPAAKGVFLTFEGIDGSGKSTALHRIAEHLTDRGLNVLTLREPGGTPFGEEMRRILRDPNTPMCDLAQLLAFNASRAQIVETVIKPALKDGTVVLCDRFYDSTMVYQGGCGEDIVRQICTIATAGLAPDRTFLFDLSPEAAKSRITSRSECVDRFDGVALETLAKWRAAYLRLARSEERFCVINAERTFDLVFASVRDEVSMALDRKTLAD